MIRRIVFGWKRGESGENAEQGFAAVIVFVPRERVDFFDTLKPQEAIPLPAVFLSCVRSLNDGSSNPRKKHDE